MRLRRAIAILRKNGVADIYFGNKFEFHLRGCEEGCDHLKNICVASRGIVESGCINQNDTTAVQIESTPKLYHVRARSQSSTNAKAGTADEIDELCKSCDA